MIFSYVNRINLLIYAESVVMAQALCLFLPKRSHYLLRLLVSTLLFSALSYLFPVLDMASFWRNWGYSIFMYLSLLLFTLLSVYVCVKATWINYLFCAVGGYAAHHLAGTLSGAVDKLIWGDDGHQLLAEPYVYTYFVGAAAVYLLLILLFYRNKNVQILVNRRQTVLLAFIIVMLNIVISSFSMLSEIYHVSLPIPISDFYNFATSILVVAFLFGVLERGYLEREVEIINSLYKENVRQYEVSRATMESLHDLKHQINAVMAGKAALSQDERNEISDKIFFFDSMVKTGNETLDIIVAEKMMLCHQYGIEFDCMADGSGLSFMDVHDIYSLFGNALSNAIEAVCRRREGAARVVSLSIRRSNGCVAVHLENTFDGEIVLEDGVPVTSKEDKLSHGFGVKSMYRITGKYGGTMTITVLDELFNLDILFQWA